MVTRKTEEMSAFFYRLQNTSVFGWLNHYPYPPFFLCVCSCVGACLCVYGCVGWMHVEMSICVCGDLKLMSSVYPSHSLFAEHLFLTDPEAHQFQLVQLASLSVGFPLLVSWVLELTGGHHTCPAFPGVLGIEFWSSHKGIACWAAPES